MKIDTENDARITTVIAALWAKELGALLTTVVGLHGEEVVEGMLTTALTTAVREAGTVVAENDEGILRTLPGAAVYRVCASTLRRLNMRAVH